MNDTLKHEFFKNKWVMITGGLGFIGSNLATRLVQYGCTVIIVDSKVEDTGWNYFNIDSIKRDVRVFEMNISDPAIKTLLSATDYIFNLAGVLSHIDSMKDPVRDLTINTLDQLKFLSYCKEVKPQVKIVYTGTRNQYGRSKYLPVKENHPLDPVDCNGVSEIAAEMYHRLFWKSYGLQTLSVRLCNVFGPRHQMRHSKQGVLNWFIRQLMDGQNVQLMGTGQQIRESIFVDDLVEALVVLMMSNDSAWGEAYNIGAHAISLKSFVETVITVLGKGSYSIIPFSDERKMIEPGDYIADYSKLKTTTLWNPVFTLSNAISITVEYYSQFKQYYW